MIVEYAGLTKEASSLIERFRSSPDETKADIIVRVLSPFLSGSPSNASAEFFDVGQGARLNVGEHPVLYLSEDAKRLRKPDAIAEVRKDGFYLDGQKIAPSKGSVLQPAMRRVQEGKNHRNNQGEIIALSAWRQWHVERDGKLCSLLELKDPALARKRGRALVATQNADELGL